MNRRKNKTGGSSEEVPHIKTTVRMPEALHREAKAKTALLALRLEHVETDLLDLWVRRAPGRLHIDLRPDGDIVMLTPEEIEEDLAKLRKGRK